MELRYPLAVFNDRDLPPGYAGPVFVWDVDKTYLSTRFSSLSGLARIPIEFSVDKVAIPGMPEVLRGLRRGPGATYGCAPIYFVSASPPQIRRSIESKMLLDGVEHDGITFKDWRKTLAALRPGRLKEQVGYKLCALLDGRSRRPHAVEYLFGDDYEADAAAYALYARIASGELRAGEAEAAMAAAGVALDDRRCVRALLDRFEPTPGAVGRIFIHLEKGTDPALYAPFGGILVPVRGAFQLALALFAMDLVDAVTVAQARAAIAAAPGKWAQDPAAMRADAIARGLISEEKTRELP